MTSLSRPSSCPAASRAVRCCNEDSRRVRLVLSVGVGWGSFTWVMVPSSSRWGSRGVRSVAEGDLDDLDHDQRRGQEQVSAQYRQPDAPAGAEGGSGQHGQWRHTPGGAVQGGAFSLLGFLLLVLVVAGGPGEVGAGEHR